jgi:hypothetical protein
MVKKVSKTELVRMKSNQAMVVRKANQLKVTTVKQEDKAYDILKEIRAQQRLIEEKRISITGPLNQALRETNDMFKVISAPLKDAAKLINDRILEFKIAQDAKAEAKQAKKEKIQASHKARGHETHELVPEVAETGKSVMQKRWTYELVDIKKVPAKYLQLQLGPIRKAIDAGERKIPGLRIFQKPSLSVR